MTASVVLFTRDLRLHDHPALTAAAHDGAVVALFVLDPSLLRGMHRSPNRVALLVDALEDLRRGLVARGGSLVIRRGDPVAETVAVATSVRAAAVHCSADVSGYARRREHRLAVACAERGIAMHRHPGVTVVPAGTLLPSGADHYRIFTPYWRAWRAHPRRAVIPAPRRIRGVASVEPGAIPAAAALLPGAPSPRLQRGGETAARARMHAWLRDGIERYADRRDALDDGATSRLSAHLHLGTLSATELAERGAGSEAFLRQLCWRDFHHQVTGAFPEIARRPYRPRGRDFRAHPDALAAWIAGRTGEPVVDAAMRQLRSEGWMPNRARLIAAGHLVRTLGVDWRAGADHFMTWLADGDLANNYGNWQWVAGTGNDTRPNRGFNAARQARRFDPQEAYVRAHPPGDREPAGSRR